ncbi:hypothetical protein DFH08DRAFT_281733 [Mycena albidolilacea]|uniref:Cytochrome P450 n=1 Tax=Mycena albidolilacea TaxID=1033008 RepID=A0AAD6ZSJ3_9AGAR|nr:hypothetical protein DFH08DRAFT_281733 [Mycena albidolilacea]
MASRLSNPDAVEGNAGYRAAEQTYHSQGHVCNPRLLPHAYQRHQTRVRRRQSLPAVAAGRPPRHDRCERIERVPAVRLGRTACPGRFFATYEIKLFIALLVARYEMSLPQGMKVDHPGFTFQAPPAGAVRFTRQAERDVLV